MKLARAFRCPVEWLMHGDGRQPSLRRVRAAVRAALASKEAA